MDNIALVDMDGTLCDYDAALRHQVHRILGEQADPWDPKHKNLVDMIKSYPGFWRDLPRIPFGLEIVDYLQCTGWQVHILTKGPHRTTSAWTEKVEWCREWLPGIPVTITEDKGLVYGKILFDDWPDYCSAWLKWRSNGLVIMPKYDYNEKFALDNPKSIIRGGFDNIDQVKAAIDSAANRKPGESLRV